MAYITNTTASLLQSFLRSKLSTSTGNVMLQQVSSAFIIEVISALHKVHRFKNFLLYISGNLNISSAWTDELFENLFDTFPLVPSIIMTSGNKTLQSATPMHVLINSFDSLSLVFTTATNDSIMALTSKSMKRIHRLKTIFILLPVMESDAFYHSDESFERFWKIINETYAWIWREQFLNAILLTMRNNIYIINPYPKLDIINKTNNWHVADFFKDYRHNFKGYILEAVVRYDLPRVFNRHYEQNKLVFNGSSGKLFTTFVEFINATLLDPSTMISTYEPAEMSAVIALIANHTIESSPHSFTELFETNHVGTSYPIGINDWCIIVPFYNRYPEHLYLQHSFQNSTWLLVLFAVIYISFALWLCTPKRPREYSTALLQAICSILYISPTSARIFSTLNLRMCFLFVCLFVLGFVTTNWYATKIASYLMTSLPATQLDTMDDVIRAGLRIKIFDYEYEHLQMMPEQYSESFLKQLDVVDKKYMDHHRNKLNTSFGYSIQTDRWEFLNLQQQFLKQPLFRNSKICMGPFHHVFPLYTDSHLERPLKHFIMRAAQAGLLIYWRGLAFGDAVRVKLVKIIVTHDNARPVSLRFFLPIWYVWGFGLTISVIFFICELFCFKRELVLKLGLRTQKP